ALKTSEGVAKMFASFIKQEIEKSWLNKIVGAIAYPIWRGLKQKMNPSNYNGASLVGLTGIVIKSHGSADQDSFAQALKVAIKAIEQDIPSLIAQHLPSQE
ncbi:MAG TPA: phosphate acyltransferase, partial [Agitococcus sp.]|nr:phosphate acyltransferase [Agitococcus sp.]